MEQILESEQEPTLTTEQMLAILTQLEEDGLPPEEIDNWIALWLQQREEE